LDSDTKIWIAIGHVVVIALVYAARKGNAEPKTQEKPVKERSTEVLWQQLQDGIWLADFPANLSELDRRGEDIARAFPLAAAMALSEEKPQRKMGIELLDRFFSAALKEHGLTTSKLAKRSAESRAWLESAVAGAVNLPENWRDAARFRDWSAFFGLLTLLTLGGIFYGGYKLAPVLKQNGIPRWWLAIGMGASVWLLLALFNYGVKNLGTRSRR
jgi:hypothetical protein